MRHARGQKLQSFQTDSCPSVLILILWPKCEYFEYTENYTSIRWFRCKLLEKIFQTITDEMRRSGGTSTVIRISCWFKMITLINGKSSKNKLLFFLEFGWTILGEIDEPFRCQLEILKFPSWLQRTLQKKRTSITKYTFCEIYSTNEATSTCGHQRLKW